MHCSVEQKNPSMPPKKKDSDKKPTKQQNVRSVTTVTDKKSTQPEIKDQDTVSDIEDEEREPDFSSSFSNETMMWMRRIIRVQAADVLNNELARGEVIGKAKLLVEVNELKTLIHTNSERLDKRMSELESTIRQLKDDNSRKEKLIRRMEFEDQKNKKQITELLVTVDELEQDKLRRNIQIVGLPESKKAKDPLQCLPNYNQEKFFWCPLTTIRDKVYFLHAQLMVSVQLIRITRHHMFLNSYSQPVSISSIRWTLTINDHAVSVHLTRWTLTLIHYTDLDATVPVAGCPESNCRDCWN